MWFYWKSQSKTWIYIRGGGPFWPITLIKHILKYGGLNITKHVTVWLNADNNCWYLEDVVWTAAGFGDFLINLLLFEALKSICEDVHFKSNLSDYWEPQTDLVISLLNLVIKKRFSFSTQYKQYRQEEVTMYHWCNTVSLSVCLSAALWR